MSESHWKETNVLVTGGASFIGSHLVDKLVELGANVTVVDNLSSGKKENLTQSWNKIKFSQTDLEYITKDKIKELFKDQNKVFHLAAVHGVRRPGDRRAGHLRRRTLRRQCRGGGDQGAQDGPCRGAGDRGEDLHRDPGDRHGAAAHGPGE